MKFSYNWIKELSGTKKSAEEIAELFLTHSFEVEGVEDLSKGLDKVVVGEVLSVEKHPDADRLNVAQVRVGAREEVVPRGGADSDGRGGTSRSADKKSDILQIVCGAPNLEVGQLVPVALVGAKLTVKDKNGQEQEFEIKKSKIRGVESNGMICAEDELGIGDDHEGIMVLREQPQTGTDLTQTDAEASKAGLLERSDSEVKSPAFSERINKKSPKIGQSFAEYMNLNDKILDIDILPNRGHDCLSYRGIVQELNALENNKKQITRNKQISNFKSQIPNIDDQQLKVDIDTENCGRYAGVKIKNIKLAPSPLWIQARLKASGLKPINNVVDITNYVMLETGQPLHAFDAESVSSQKSKVKSQIVVRQAKEGEKIVLLDEQKLELMKDDIVITDGEKPIALAGVMGGLGSGIKDDTKEIILEGANFNSSSIRFTARRYNLQTDAAYRFERDIDPNFVDIALSRAVELMQELAGGEVETITDVYPEPVKPWTINLSLDYVRRLLGVEISDEEIESILKRLGVTSSKSRTNADLTRTNTEGLQINTEDMNKFPQTKKVLGSLKEIKKIADERGIKFWVLGGLACAFHAGQIYREHDDLDLITKTEEDRQKLLKLLKENGFEKIRTKKLTDKLSVDIYKNKVEVEAVIGEYLKEFGLTDDDFENEELELAGVKSLVLSKRFIKSVKDRQLKERTKSKDQLDLDYLDVRRLSCVIPTRRRDLRTEEDLIEEVGRIYGYDKIKPKPIQAPVQTPHRNEQRFLERDLKNIAVQSGFSEIRSYSFHSEEDAKALGLDNLKHIELLNPASPEQLMLRNTLAVGLLKAGRKSLSYFPEVRIFEISKVYRAVDKILPEEVVCFGGAVFSKNKNGEQFYELKGLVDNLLQGLGIEDYYYDPTSPKRLRGASPSENNTIYEALNLHPSRRAIVKTESGEIIGWLGEITKQENKYFGLKNVRGAVVSLNVEKMLELSQEKNSFQPLPKFPFVERDLSMIVPEKMKVKEVEDVLFKVGGQLLKDVDLFDLYYNKETGERSMAFHLLFGDKEKTLQAKEVDAELVKIIEKVEGELGVKVRK